MMKIPLRAAVLAFAFAIAGAQAALAQEPTQSDLTALRYYHDQGNEEAMVSEMRRLMLEFPDWTPPENVGALFAEARPQQIDEVYRLIDAGYFDGARELIAEIDAAYPDWTPPAEMMEHLSLADAQSEFDDAQSTGDVTTLVNIVRGVPALLSCERVNNAWLLAEAHLSQGDTEAALSVYRAVTQTCSAPELLVATLEKAAEVASTETLAELSDIAQRQAPDAVTQLRRTEDRLRAGRQEEPRWTEQEQVIALQTTRPEPSPQQAAAPQAETGGGATAASAPAPSSGGGGTVAAVRSAAERGAWSECLSRSAGSSNVDVIFQRGWCAYNADRSLEAISAFDEAVRRARTSDMRREASYGLLLSMLRMNMTEQAAQVAATAPLTRTQRIEIEGQILDQRGVRAYESGDFANAAAFFAAHARLTGTTRRDLALLHGYALLRSGDRDGARAIFERLHRQLATAETRRAMRALE
jgi:TolA-binding protein